MPVKIESGSEGSGMILLRDGKSRMVIHPATSSVFFSNVPGEVFRMDATPIESLDALEADVSETTDGWVAISPEEVHDWISEFDVESLATLAVRFLNKVRH